jgi:hypothetical protein
MPIREMCEFVALVREGDGSVVRRAQVLERHRAGLIAELDRLARFMTTLDAKIAHYRQRELEMAREAATKPPPGPRSHERTTSEEG